ncbi:MAG: hypothetical protein HY927_05350 [Elusimicrobia bacterium]|nr:hypothetical protein [Elusimicrobiota bacterium]
MKNRFFACLMSALLGAQCSWAAGYAGPRTMAVPAPGAAARTPVVTNPALLGGIPLPVANPVPLPGIVPGASLSPLPGGLPESFVIGMANAAEVRFAPAEVPGPQAAAPGDPMRPSDATPGTAGRGTLPAAPQGALESAQKLAEAFAPGADGDAKPTEALQSASDRYFDRNLAGPEDNDVAAVPPDVPLSDAALGDGLAGEAGSSRLSKLYPRVVFIQDVFSKPASAPTVAYIEKLLNEGVRIVFMTWRPAKGEGSAEDILLGKLKNRTGNPIMVVSHNGGRITQRSRSQNPKPIVADASGFRPEHLETFRQIAGKVEASLGLPAGAIAQSEVSSDEAVYSHVLRLPASVPDADAPAMLAAMIRSYNAQLKKAKLPYMMTVHPGDPRAAVAHAMPLRFAVPRVMEALRTQFPEDRIDQSADKFLVLADTRKSPKLATSFPKESEIQALDSDQGVADALGAVLGERTLPSVSVNLGKLRQFVEYWEPVHRLSSSDAPAFRRGGSGSIKGGGPVDQKLAMYTGTILYQLMAYIYDQTWQGQHNAVRLGVLQAKLRSLWFNPFKNGIRINKGLAQAMKSKAWKARQRGYIEKANAYLTNYYMREFGDYTAGARNVQENLVGLATFRNSLITLDFESAATGKFYKIHTRIPRVMKADTSMGRVLTAYSYRTGKEAPDDGEQLLAQTLAMALLKGYGRIGPDGRWHHGAADGPVLAEVRVQLEYMTSHRTVTFKPEQLLQIVASGQARASGYDVIQGPVAQQITSSIERMEADVEYQKYYEEHEEKPSAQDLAKKKSSKGKAAKAPKGSAKKPAKKPAGRQG